MDSYRVEFFMDNDYQVLYGWDDIVAFQGSLSDCEAFIKLKEGGYM